MADEVFSHLKAQHTPITTSEAKRACEIVQAIPGIIRNQTALRKWTVPPPTTAPIPLIAPPEGDGLACQRCPYVARQIFSIQEHCRKENGWINERRRGRCTKKWAAKERSVPWRTGVRCQRFFRSRVASGWFEVGRGTQADGEAGREAEEVDRVAEFLNRIHREDEEAFESEAKATIRDIDDKWEAERWLNRVGWPRHLEKVDKDKLRGAMQPIGEDEPELQQMWTIFERVLDRAYTAAVSCSPGTAELYEVERKEIYVTPDTPFNGKMETGSWSKYKEKWRTLLCIWQRVESWEDDKRPPYRMTIKQPEMWNGFSKGVKQVILGSDTTGRYTEDRLERMCLGVVIGLLDHPLRSGNHYESIIISGLAVIGLEDRGGWVKVTEYTPIYSAVIKVAKYLVLYQSMLERQDEITRLWQTMDKKQADESATGLFRIVRDKVRRFMTRISDEKDAEPTPMNWIINTRTYELKIRFMTPGDESIDWRGDQIVHGRVRLGMG